MRILSIAEAAALLQKSERQIRYMVQQGQLSAVKSGGRWVIKAEDLPLTDAQRVALGEGAERIVEAAEMAVEPARKAAGAAADATLAPASDEWETLANGPGSSEESSADPPPESSNRSRSKSAGKSGKRRFSVQTLRVFSVAKEVYHDTVETCGDESPATRHLRQCLDSLARGCHSYHSRPKLEHYCSAREAAASAMVDLLVAAGKDNTGPSAAIAERIEQELMGPFTGLIRKAESSKKNGKGGRFTQFG